MTGSTDILPYAARMELDILMAKGNWDEPMEFETSQMCKVFVQARRFGFNFWSGDLLESVPKQLEETILFKWMSEQQHFCFYLFKVLEEDGHRANEKFKQYEQSEKFGGAQT